MNEIKKGDVFHLQEIFRVARFPSFVSYKSRSLKDCRMDIDKLKSEAEVGNITKEYVDYLKNLYITEIIKAGDPKSAGALVSYGNFLNELRINSDNYPLYLKILESNNRYAIDALLEGHDLEHYLDCVTPNHFIVKTIFTTFSLYKRNEIYDKTLRVFFGFLIKVYHSPEEGYQLYQPSIADINSLAKILEETKGQDDPLNRDILDILMYIADLDAPHEDDQHKKEVARQAGRIRSDFFDGKRRLNQSLTDVTLEKAEKVIWGIPPDYVYYGGDEQER